MDSKGIKTVGKYTYSPNEVLGVGMWGTVYKATSKDAPGKEFALKKINKYKIEASEASFMKYQREVEALRKSKNIQEVIDIEDFFKSASSYYIVTAYIRGSTDLEALMRQNRFKFCEQEARNIWRDVLKGIMKLHSAGICHRDLKPQNVLYIPGKKKAKIIDFGVAGCFGNMEGLVGSYLFMAPQVLLGLPYTQKCDIWSLGVLFYYMVYRVSPYGTDPSAQFIKQRMAVYQKESLTLPFSLYVSPPCQQVLRACLQYDECDRAEAKSILELPFFD